MTKKPVAKKRSVHAQDKNDLAISQKVKKMTGGVMVGGNISAGRDVIQGDQFNDYRQQLGQISSPQDFVAELQKLLEQIAALKQAPELNGGDRQLVEVVEGRLAEAAEEAAKLEPKSEDIVTTLEKAKKTLDALTAGVTSAIGLGTTIGSLVHHIDQLGSLAHHIFGG
jgi:hypothetical protein